MNKLFVAAAVLATSSFSALAGGLATYQPAQQFTSTVSRAEVRAELARAAANGELVAGERSSVAPVQARALSTSTVSRAEVRAELVRAAANGELVAGERSYVAPVQGRALSREEVRAQLDSALRKNQVPSGEFALAAEAPTAASTQLGGR